MSTYQAKWPIDPRDGNIPQRPEFAQGGQETAKRLLTVLELAQYLGVPRSWVYDRTRKNGPERLPHIRLGKYVRFDLETVEHYLKKHKQGFSERDSS